MACHLLNTNLWSEPVIGYCWFDPWEQLSEKCKSKYKDFHSRKCIWNVVRKFCVGLSVLSQEIHTHTQTVKISHSYLFLRIQIDHKSTLVQLMARHWKFDKPLLEPIYVTNEQINMIQHNYMFKQFHITPNRDNLSSRFRDVHSVNLSSLKGWEVKNFQ